MRAPDKVLSQKSLLNMFLSLILTNKLFLLRFVRKKLQILKENCFYSDGTVLNLALKHDHKRKYISQLSQLLVAVIVSVPPLYLQCCKKGIIDLISSDLFGSLADWQKTYI